MAKALPSLEQARVSPDGRDAHLNKILQTVGLPVPEQEIVLEIKREVLGRWA